MKRFFPEALICALLVISVFIVFYQTRHYSYILYDDIIAATTPYITDGITLKKAIKSFSNPFDNVPYLSPVTIIIAMIQSELCGDDYGLHHLFFVVWHTITVIILFLFLQSATDKRWESAFCAMIFAIHPINVESIVWLAGMNGLLEGFFLALTLLLYRYYLKNPSLMRYILLFPPFTLGLLCKPTIAVLPFLLLCLDYWPFHRLKWISFNSSPALKKKDVEKVLLEKIPFLLIITLYILKQMTFSTAAAPSISNALINFSPGTILDFTLFIKKIFYPTGLTIGYPPPPKVALIAAVAILAGFVGITVFFIRKTQLHKYIITGWLWFLISASPAVLVMSLSGRPIADRHLYIPLIGIFIIIAYGTGAATKIMKYENPIRLILFVLVLAALAITSRAQTRHWENSITIFQHSLSINPNNEKALANLGDALMEKGDIDQAISYYRRLVNILPQNASAHTKLAKALSIKGLTAKAEAHYQKALELSPNYEFAHHNYGDFLISQGKVEEAIKHYRRALLINPRLFKTHNNLATALIEQGEITKAIFHLQQALAINPAYKTARDNLNRIRQIQRDILNGIPIKFLPKTSKIYQKLQPSPKVLK